jgi:hypothetical protein
MPAYDDLNFQATTRGGRVMDYVLGRKAVFKSTTGAIGDAALTGAAISADRARELERENRQKERSRDKRTDDQKNRDEEKVDNAQDTALVLGIIGGFAKLASAATVARADTRQWDTLPQRLSFAAYHLGPGLHSATLQYFDRQGNVLSALTQHVVIPVPAPAAGGAPLRDTVIFLSELKQ